MSKALVLSMVLAAVLMTCMAQVAADSTPSIVATPLIAAAPVASSDPLDPKTVYQLKIDPALRSIYWYYLTKATLLYRASLRTGDKYIFLSIYRNIVGTFLAVTRWENGQNKAEINTLVRLGDGWASGSGANYKPVNVDYNNLDLVIGAGERYTDGYDGFTNQTLLQCKIVDEGVRKEYWYYLLKSDAVATFPFATAAKSYCITTYINNVGIFLHIGDYNLAAKVSATATLVRLGDGYSGSTDTGPIKLTTTTLNFA